MHKLLRIDYLRLVYTTHETFDRDEAARLLPKSNPFLKRFFQSLRDDLDE
ncbi:MAG: hypothetical protein ACPHY8_05240 [Patescibacteria group bacterium]